MSQTKQLSFLSRDFEAQFINLSSLKRGSTISKEVAEKFNDHLYTFYRDYKRPFCWRWCDDPYKIVVSEIMLQQTQTFRVEPKFDQFIQAFPTFTALAKAPFSEVLFYWQGLGYNRRALYLQKIAQKVVGEFNNVLPDVPDILQTFPGIGQATAASICTFAYNKATIFIETNIRTVFIYTFFSNARKAVTDDRIKPLIVRTLDRENPRDWYYALMDYGVTLKKQFKNPSRLSAHHTKQSSFEGSERQIRGMILRVLLKNSRLNFAGICDLIAREPKRIEKNLAKLVDEGLILENDRVYCLRR